MRIHLKAKKFRFLFKTSIHLLIIIISVIGFVTANSGINLIYAQDSGDEDWSPAKEIGTDIKVTNDDINTFYMGLHWFLTGYGCTKGYFGLQSSGSTYNCRHVHLAVWGACNCDGTKSDGTPCTENERPIIKFPTEYNSYSDFTNCDDATDCSNGCAAKDDSEGNAIICIRSLNWEPNKLYRLRVTIENCDEGSEYKAYFKDYSTNSEVLVARIIYPLRDMQITRVDSVLERFGDVDCTNELTRSMLVGNAYKILSNGEKIDLCKGKAYYDVAGVQCPDNRNVIAESNYFKLESGTEVISQSKQGDILNICNENLDPSPIVDGVRSICPWGIGGTDGHGVPGVPGPVEAFSENAIPIVSGDDDTTPINATVAIASSLGDGRIVALGHDGFFINSAMDLFDNELFGNNIIDWLNGKDGTKKVLVTTGHGEPWVGTSEYYSFFADLESRGYTVTKSSESITPELLSDIGVLFISIAWKDVSDSEITTITDYVSKGGGLYLSGLGWAWKQYNDPNLDTYPMNKIGRPFGVRWIDGYISDPTNNHEGAPIFHTFYS